MINIRTLINIFAYTSVFIAFLSVVRFVDMSYITIFLLLFVASIIFDALKKDEERKEKGYKVLLNFFSIMIIAFSMVGISKDNITQPVLNALIVLTGIKLAEYKEFRDYMQIFALSIFILAGSALMSIDIIFLVYFISLFFVVSIGLVVLTYYSQDKSITFTKKQTIQFITKISLIPLIAIPITAIIFVILPRTNYPLLTFLNKAGNAKTGFNSNITLGEVAQIQEDSSVAFRVKMEKIDDSLLYFRAVVLDKFDGKNWYRVNSSLRNQRSTISTGSKIIKSVVYLSPYGESYIFGLNVPVRVYGLQTNQFNDYVYKATNPITQVVRYTAISILTKEIPEKNINKDIYLYVPESIKSTLLDFAKELKKDKNPYEFARYLKTYFQKNYKYSLENLPITDNPVVDFLLKYKYGNCEYFASATAVLFRLNGIPSRIVGGYKGGIYNDTAGYYAVFQKNAHTWIEYYFEGKWHFLDTTPATVNQYIPYTKTASIVEKIKMVFDTINYYYINLIIDYNFQKQMNLFKNVKNIGKHQFRQLKSIEIHIKDVFIFVILILVIFLATKYIIGYINKTQEEKILERFLKKMEKLGYKKLENQGLEEFINNIDDSNIKQLSREFVSIFESVYYKDKTLTKSQIKQLESILEKLR